MDTRDLVPLLEAIIEKEREHGCPMAHANLIGPALRRWKSYERRNKRNKDKSLDHRTLDLEKGLLALFPEHNYDPACIAHLAKSFAEVLFHGCVARSPDENENCTPPSAQCAAHFSSKSIIRERN